MATPLPPEAYGALPSDADLAAMGMTAQQFADLQNSIAGISGSPILSGPLDLIGGSSPYSRTINEADYLIGAPKSNKGNPTSTLRQSSNDFFVYEGQKVRLVDNKTGQVIFEGAGPADAKKASDMAAQLTSEGGRKANWDIQVGPQTLDTSMMGVPTRAEGSWMTVANENPNAPLGKFGEILGTALPIAMIPLTMGASAPLAGLGTAGNIALGAGVGAASAGLKGQNILKGGLTGGLSAAGSEFLGPLVQSVGDAGKVATLLGRAVGSGIGATAGGLATGQSLQNSLIGGGITAGTTYLGGKLFGSSPTTEDLINQNVSRAMGGIENALIDAGAYAPDILDEIYRPTAFGGAKGVSVGQAPSPVIPATDLTVTGTRIGATPSSAGAAPSFAVNVPAGGTPETIVTAQRQTPVAEQPSFAVNVPTQTPAVGGPDLEETIVTAQDEGLQQAEQPGFAVNTSGLLSPEIIATAQKEAALTQEEPSLAVLPPATTTGPDTLVTGQREIPQVEQEQSFAVLPPATTTGPDTLVTGQRETPLVEEKPTFAVMPPATTTGPDTLVTGQRETPVVKEEPSFAALPPATTTGPDTLVTGKREDVKLDDKEGVGGPYIPPKSEIVVTGDKGTPKFDEDGTYVGPLVNIPSLVDDAVQEELAGKKTEPEKKLDVADYLKLAGLAVGLGAKLFDGNGSTGSAGRYSSTGRLSPAFTDKLPTPGQGGAFTVGGLGGTAADRTFAARPVTDWYRYGMGPAMDIPAGADLSRATSPYAGFGPGTLGQETFNRITAGAGPEVYNREPGFTGTAPNQTLGDTQVVDGATWAWGGPQRGWEMQYTDPATGQKKTLPGNGATNVSSFANNPTIPVNQPYFKQNLTNIPGWAETYHGWQKAMMNANVPQDVRFAAEREFMQALEQRPFNSANDLVAFARSLYNRSTQPRAAAHGGSMGYSRGSSRESFAVNGPGTGRSDDIPAVLSDGEYVIDAETVALLGDGSSKAGAKKLDEMRVKVRKHKGKNLAKGKFSVNARRPEAYMSGGRI